MELSKLQQQFLKDVLNAKPMQKIVISVYYIHLGEIKIFDFDANYLKLIPIIDLVNYIEDKRFPDERTTYKVI